MTASGTHLALPADARRRARALALLRGGRVAAIVRGRQPLLRDELVSLVAQHHGLSVGGAEAAVRHAALDGQVVCFVALPTAGPVDELPDAARVLQSLESGSKSVRRARRKAG